MQTGLREMTIVSKTSEEGQFIILNVKDEHFQDQNTNWVSLHLAPEEEEENMLWFLVFTRLLKDKRFWMKA